MSPLEMLTASVHHGLTEKSEDAGENAGDRFVSLASDPGLDLADSQNVYKCAINHAAVADIITTGIRSHWEMLPPIPPWMPSCYTADGFLRRFLPVQHWSEDREIFERRSWFCLGEVCHYRMPMQLVVAIVGHMSYGRRVGYFSKGLFHVNRSHLRFRRKGSPEGFKESWTTVYREDRPEINREKWLQALLADDVLGEILFVVNIDVPPIAVCDRIQDLAKRQIEKLYRIKELPDKQLSTCFDPISPCAFRGCCHGEPESEPERGLFRRI